MIKRVNESILIDEIANQNIENKAKNLKNSGESVEVVNEMEKITRSNKCCLLLLACQQAIIFEKFKANNKFINLVNNFGISRSTMAFKISINYNFFE